MLKTKKEEINEVIEASQEAHEQREEAKHKTIMPQEQSIILNNIWYFIL